MHSTPPFHGSLLSAPLLLPPISGEALLLVSQCTALTASLAGKATHPTLSFLVPTEKKYLQWQTVITHFLILMKNQVPEPPGARKAP